MKHTFKNWLAECRRLSGDPRYIGRGMAIGVFVSMTPFFPFHTALALAGAFILRGSKRAAAASVWLSNPLTIPFLYFLIYKLGVVILGMESVYNPDWKTFEDIIQMGIDIVYAMVIGGIVLGCALGLPTYYITKFIFRRIQRRESLAAVQPSSQAASPVNEVPVKPDIHSLG